MNKEQEIKTTNHLIHAVLAVLTAGMWIPIWLLAWAGSGVRGYTVALFGIMVILLWLFK
jgi:hypothetical protein